MQTERETFVAAPLARVFSLVEDPVEMLRWQPQRMELIDDPTPRVAGHRFTMRVQWRGRPFDTQCVIVARNPPHFFSFQTLVMGQWVTTEWELGDALGGCRVTVRSKLPQNKGIGRFFEWIWAPKFRALSEKGMDDQLAALRRYAEAT